MRVLVYILLQICKLSVAFPRTVICVFLVVGAAGFSVMPFITTSTNLLAGFGETNPAIRLTLENGRIFGERDSLIVVLEFPEPPGEERLPFIAALGESIARLPGVRQVRYRYVDPEDDAETTRLLKSFVQSMTETEREDFREMFSPEWIEDALRRNRNRLFLTENPYIQRRILEDPLELGRFISQCMQRRVGSVSFSDIYLLLASPDSTQYLIQVTPDFLSSDIVQSVQLVDRVRQLVPAKIAELRETLTGAGALSDGVTWRLTGRTAFQSESDVIFDREAMTIVLSSLILVIAFLGIVYRSFRSTVILLVPLAAGIGPNYGVIYLSYDEVNPVVSAANGVLLGLGIEYGVHLWGRFRQEIDRGCDAVTEALPRVYEKTGPAVALGALISILTMLCLCLSDQPAISQFGYVGAVGLILTFCSTAFLFPAMVRILSDRKKDHFPTMRVSFKIFTGLFRRRSGLVVGVTFAAVVAGAVFASRVSYEQDLFKVFFARDMESVAVSDLISRKFQSNFAQPTLVSFEAESLEDGLLIQRIIDETLQRLMHRNREIASYDSISYLMAPDAIRALNVQALAEVTGSWPQIRRSFSDALARCGLSRSAIRTAQDSFDATGRILKDLQMPASGGLDNLDGMEHSRYIAKVNGKYRFLTQIRYASFVNDHDQLRKADKDLTDALRTAPVAVSISGTRQAMEAVVSTVVSDLFKLGLYAYIATALLLAFMLRNLLGVVLCLVPLTGALCISLGIIGATGMGVPFSIVAVAPLLFGLGMDNGIHVVMGTSEGAGTIPDSVARVAGPILFTSLTNVLGFVAMLTSRHYALEFLGWAVLIGMAASVTLTFTTLPALLLMLKRRC